MNYSNTEKGMDPTADGEAEADGSGGSLIWGLDPGFSPLNKKPFGWEVVLMWCLGGGKWDQILESPGKGS